MEPKTNRILLPKDIYYAFILQCEQRYPETKVVKLNFRRRAIPYELHDKDGTILMTFDRWFNIMIAFFAEARVKIIEGERLNLYKAGFIHAKRIERNFRNKRINWKETMAGEMRFDEEKQKNVPVRKVYYTGEDYCRIGWSARSHVPSYKFSPTNSSKSKVGFKQQFSKMLIRNQYLKLSYVYYPYNK